MKPSDGDYMSVGLSVCPSAFLYVCHKKADFKNTELSAMNHIKVNPTDNPAGLIMMISLKEDQDTISNFD